MISMGFNYISCQILKALGSRKPQTLSSPVYAANREHLSMRLTLAYGDDATLAFKGNVESVTGDIDRSR